MNAVPHTHEVTIREAFGRTRIGYGDTTREIELHPSERKIRKTVKKVIRQHDIGSQQAAVTDDARKRVQEEFNSKLIKFQGRYRREPLEDLDHWPSVRMPEWEEEYEPEDPPNKIVEFSLKNSLVARSGDTLRLYFDDLVPANSGLFTDDKVEVGKLLTQKEATE